MTFDECLIKYYLRYVQRLKLPGVSTHLISGVMTHKVAEELINNQVDPYAYYQQLFLDNFGPEGLEDVLKYSEAYEKAIQDTRNDAERRGKVLKSPTFTNYWKMTHEAKFSEALNDTSKDYNLKGIKFDLSLIEVYLSGIKCIGNLQTVLATRRFSKRELTAEYSFKTTLPVAPSSGIEFPITGKLDVVAKEGDFVGIYDFKGGRTGFYQDTVPINYQIWFYNYYWYKNYGKLPDEVGIIDLNFGKNYLFKPTMEEASKFFAVIEREMELLMSTERDLKFRGLEKTLKSFTLPAGKGSKYCPCEYKDHCPMFQTKG